MQCIYVYMNKSVIECCLKHLTQLMCLNLKLFCIKSNIMHSIEFPRLLYNLILVMSIFEYVIFNIIFNTYL